MDRRINITYIEKAFSRDGRSILRTLGLPYGGPHGGLDKHGFAFSERTDFQMSVGDTIATAYFHGREKATGRKTQYPIFYGRADFVGFDDRGGWFEQDLDLSKSHHLQLWDAAEKGTLRASTGLAGTLARVFPGTRELSLWVPGELSYVEKSMTVNAVNDFAISMPLMKAEFNQVQIIAADALSGGVVVIEAGSILELGE